MPDPVKFFVSATAICLSIFLTAGASAAPAGTLNGTYAANDGSTLLVEEVPVNDGQRLTLVLRGVELSVWRKHADDVFRYRHDGCDLAIVTTGAGDTQAFSVDAGGHCAGKDAPFRNLSIRYERPAQAASGTVQLPTRDGQEQGRELSRNGIFELQFRLNQLGFDVGEPNGSLTARTRSQAAAFAGKTGQSQRLDAALLERLRQAAGNMEGWKRPDGTIKLLLFTDEGTPLMMALENWGLIFKSNARTFIRDHDRDGRPLYAQRFDVRQMERRLEIGLAQWVTFGFRMHFPTPPKGERVEIEETLTRPEIAKDGSVERKTTVWKVPFLSRPPFDPWYWYSNLEAEADTRLEGAWVMSLGQKGRTLLSRSFQLRRP